MTLRVNRETGEVFELVGGRWLPADHPSARMGAGEAALVAAGARFDDVGRAVRNFLPGADPEALATEAAEAERIMAPLRARRPASTFLGGMLPDLATAPLSGGLATQAAIGAVLGTLSYQEDPLQQLMRGGLLGAGGAAGGFLAGNMASRVGARVGRMVDAVGGDRRITAALPDAEITGRLEVEDAGLSTGARQDLLVEALEGAEDTLGIGRGGARLPAAEDMTPAQRWAVREGERLGWRFEAADFSPAAARLRAAADAHPLTAPLVSANREANRETLARTIGRALGLEDASQPGRASADLSPQALGEAADRIQVMMDELHQAAGTVSGRGVRDAAAEVVEGGRVGLVGSEAHDIARNIQGALENSVEMDPAQATLWRSQINDAFRRATSPTGRPDSAGADNLLALQNALDEAIESAVPQGQRGLYRRAREQYRLLTALRRGQAVTDAGQVNIRTLSNNLRSVYRSEYRLGRDGNLSEPVRDALRAVRVARTVDPGIGDSGTATRLSLQQMADAPIQSLVMTAAARPLGDLVGRVQRVDPTAAALPGVMDPNLYGGRIGAAVGRALAAAGQ